ncbi:hypothetical protein BIV57_02375 [Mangrovactinospora gilvigrisea]|uniref:UspA domain-containing protein n=1 Tax=Mangrovactinospora gilvigrisea TaxID=1428644 RepID=A0A1J7CC63_9ACTN|nr:universal stress protein [Mangrovactinospora gilvigrisea]OIV39092.1 hypothetical protein BIV57_02375 [Mangrovactinospora gilvigrisea]
MTSPTSTEGRVIVGVSGSPSSEAALRRGAFEARRGGRPLIALIAWGPPEGERLYYAAPCPPLLKVWEANARGTLLDQLRDNAPYLGDVEVHPMVVRAPAEDALTLLPEPEDLLVIGGGRGPLGRALHGHVRRRVLSRAGCPVLTARHPPSELALQLSARRLRRTALVG